MRRGRGSEQDARLVDVAVQVRHETDRAWLLDDGVRQRWVPKSQAQRNDDGTFTMPEWLAQDKEFI